MKKLAFTPAQHGFHFTNLFINHPLPGSGVTTSGLCGGMALAAARYWQHQLPVPTHVASDFPDGSPAGVPPEGSALQGYIYGCQLESFGPLGIVSAANWITMPWVTLGDQFNWSVSEFQAIAQRIDAGSPVVIGLRQVQGGPMGHQVLAYGYDPADNRVFVYDSNFPDEEKTLRLDMAARKIVYDANSPEWSSYFVTGCRMEGPRPDYIDLAVRSGLSVTTGSQVVAGGPVAIDVVVRNAGFRDAHLRQLSIYVRGPQNENLDALLGGGDNDARLIAPGGERRLQRTAPSFGTAPGNYVIGVSYLSNQNHSIAVPPMAPGSRTEATVHVDKGWTAWQQVAPNAIASDPAAVSWGRNRIDVFARGTDNQMYSVTWDGTRWTRWSALGGELSSGPAVASWAPNRLDVFARGKDNALWSRSWAGSAWTPWRQISPNALTSDPAAVSWGPNRIDVFARGTDNALYSISWDGTRWTGWSPLGGQLSSGPAVASWAPNRLDVFARGMDNALWSRSWIGASWTPWRQITPNPIASDPAAISREANRIDVLARGTDRQMYSISWNGSQWSGWSPLAGEFASGPAVASSAPGRLDVFGQGMDNALWTRSAG